MPPTLCDFLFNQNLNQDCKINIRTNFAEPLQHDWIRHVFFFNHLWLWFSSYPPNHKDYEAFFFSCKCRLHFVIFYSIKTSIKTARSTSQGILLNTCNMTASVMFSSPIARGYGFLPMHPTITHSLTFIALLLLTHIATKLKMIISNCKTTYMAFLDPRSLNVMYLLRPIHSCFKNLMTI